MAKQGPHGHAINPTHVEDADDLTPEKIDIVAKSANDAAHALTVREAISCYQTAIFWSLMVSMCVVMEGYDTILLGNFYAYPEFAAKYGQFIDDEGRHQLSAAWQAALSNAPQDGCFLGALLNGHLVTNNIVMSLVGEFLCGFPWGILVTCAPSYASEVLPMRLRVYLTSWTNMCFIIGQFIAAGALAGLVSRPDEWAYRIPFALQWMWPVFLIPILSFAPESPWHLVRMGKYDDARKSLARLQRASSYRTDLNIETALAEIIHTNNLEINSSAGTSYIDCFRGTELRRTEIACACTAGQALCGLSFAYNSTYFFQQVGLKTRQTYYLNTGGTGLALACTFLCWFTLMPYFGRRRIYLVGMFGMAVILIIIGILNVWWKRQAIGYTQAILTLVWTGIFQLSAGQIGWALPAEIGSTRVRQKTICLARNSYYIFSIICSVVQPYFMNPGELNLRGYTGFIWGFAICVLIWGFFRLPESKDRTFEELDLLFASGAPCRKFATAQVDIAAAEKVQLV